MSNLRFPMVCSALVVAAALAAPAYTAETVPDPSTTREFTAKMLMCEQCHGVNGTPVRPGIPILWGQREEYLVKQLQEFHSGERASELMIWAAKTLPPAELGPAAAHFAKKTWPARPAASAAAAATPPSGITVCGVCHQQNFLGTLRVEGATAPRLAGQDYQYLVESMRQFADGERTNDGTMAGIMKAISPADREAMARYMSGL